MGDFAPRVFDFGKPAVCQQPITHGGKDYKPGDAFPYEQLGLSKLQMYGFWLTSLVDFRDETPVPQTKKQQRAAR